MLKRILARLFGRKLKPETDAMERAKLMRRTVASSQVEILRRQPQPIHRNTFSSGPARNSAGVDITNPLHPAWIATIDDGGHSRGHSCNSHSSHDSGSYDSGSSDSGSSSSGGCD